LSAREPEQAWSAPGVDQPSATPLPPRRGTEHDRGAPARRIDEALRARMTFDLQSDGRLLATGTIEPGTAEIFAAEIAKRGSYVNSVVLHSPGGSVTDALAMGRLIRQKKFATEVEGASYCASSCPLVFAGGVERRAADKAAIGVHQVTAFRKDAGGLTELTGASGMDSAQRISAECQKYLREMGIDLQVWLHAMETPKEQLYYFKPDELLGLKLATQHGKAAADAKAKS
jgi:hypothetical protein